MKLLSLKSFNGEKHNSKLLNSKLQLKIIRSYTKDIKKVNNELIELETKILDYKIKTKKILEILEEKKLTSSKDKKYLNYPSLTLIPFEFTDETDIILEYIINKKHKNENDIFFIQHYLTNFSRLLNELNKSQFLNVNILLNKISEKMKFYQLTTNQLLFRFGDEGDNFYFIFSGKFALFVPKEIKFELNYNQYLQHLNKLFKLKEFGLILKIIEENIKIFNSFDILQLKNSVIDLCDKTLNTKNEKNKLNNSYSSNAFSKLKDKESFQRKLTFSKKIKEKFNIEQYINSVLPKFEKKNYKNENELITSENRTNKELITLYIYYHIGNLNKFSTFGEFSLGEKNKNIHRTASIISLEKSIIGYIKNNDYSDCMKSTFDTLRCKNINLIKQIPLFQFISLDAFNEKYFNYFHLHIYKRGEIIFNQNDERKKIYIIREGEIELSMKSSIKDLNKIIFKFSPNDILIRNKIINKNKYNDDDLADLYNNDNEINYWKILNHFSFDIFGLEDCIFENNKYFVNSICKSENAYIYEVEINFFLNIIHEEKIYNIYVEYIKFKKLQMIKRLQQIRMNKINIKYFEKEKTFLNMTELRKIKKKKKFHLNINLINNKLFENEKFFYLKNKKNTINKSINVNSDLSLSNSKIKYFTPIKNIKYLTQNNSSLNSFNNYSISNSSDSKTKKRKIQKNLLNLNKNIKSEKYIIKTETELNNSNNYKNISSLRTYIQNIRLVNLKKPKIDPYSETMFQLNSFDFKKNKKLNNSDENTIDFLVFDKFIQSKFYLNKEKKIMKEIDSMIKKNDKSEVLKSNREKKLNLFLKSNFG